LTINGARYYLWRAVDQDDNVLDILVQSRRNKKAAKKFFKKLLKRRMQRFKFFGHAQRFLSAYRPIAQHFRPRRHLLAASAYRQEMRQRFQKWREITGTAMVA
jgi:putative transposase